MCASTRDVIIAAGEVKLDAIWSVPHDAAGAVIFAHGSGSSRHSKRNQFVGRTLQQRGFATLLLDLLTPQEDARDQRTGELRFDVALLAKRLEAAIDWFVADEEMKHVRLGLFGASTGAAAAIEAAAHRQNHVGAIVSRGGRPDLAGSSLHEVQAPTLLIVGGNDAEVLALNLAASKELACEKDLAVVGGAGHLFEEPGALEQVAELARSWFLDHLTTKDP